MILIYANTNEAYLQKDLLDKEILEQALGKSESRQRQFLANRALLRSSLEYFYQIKKLPKICYTNSGKPFFLESRFPNFNISHSKDGICICLGDNEQGVDLEFVRARANFLAIAKRIYSKEQLDLLSKAQDKLSLFTAFWTIKECAVKVSGNGIVDASKVNFDDKGKLEYEPLSQGTTITCFNLEKLTKQAQRGFISFASDLKAQNSFYVFENQSFAKVELNANDFKFHLIKAN